MNLYSVYYLFIALIIFAIFPEIIQQSVTIDLTHPFNRGNLYPIYIYKNRSRLNISEGVQ